MNMGKKEQMGIIHRNSHPSLVTANYSICWSPEDPSVAGFNPSTEHSIPHALSALIGIRVSEQPHLASLPTHPLPTGPGAPVKLRPEIPVPCRAVLGLSVCLSIQPCFPCWTLDLQAVAGSLLLCSIPCVLCCSFDSSLISSCSQLECLDGPCSQCPLCPWCWCAVGLCQACRTGVLRQKTWGLSTWNLFLCSFKTKCFPDLGFQGGGMVFQNNLLLWDGCQGLQKIQLLGMVKE